MLRRISKVLLTLVLALSMVTCFAFTSTQDAYAMAKKAKKPKVTSVTLNHKVITIKKGKTLKLKAKVLPKKAAKKAKLTWKTSKKKVAAVKNGKVKAAKKKTGKAKITVTVKGTKKKAVCTVYVGTPVKQAVFAQSALTLKEGETAAAGASVSPAKATVKTINYSSDNEAVATVDKSGQIKAVGVGNAVITAKPLDEAGKAAKMTVTVEKAVVPVTGVKLDASEKKIEKGQSFNLTATVEPSDASNKAVSYTSSNANVATVDAAGKVSGVGKGTADITVTTADGGKTAVCKVTVTFPAEYIIEKTEDITKDVIDAVKSGEIKKLFIKGDDIKNVEIPKEDLSKASLVIDAPNGHIDNNAKFKDVQIKAISDSTYTELAGNIIKYQAGKGRIKVAEGASAEITLDSGAGSLNLVNDGSISRLHIRIKSNIEISGSSQNVTPVMVSSGAADSRLSTNQELKIDTEAKFNLNIKEGGEYTQVNIVNKSESEAAATVPTVTGLGQIPVSFSGMHYLNVVAQYTGASSSKVTIKGKVSDIYGDVAADAKVSLVSYNQEMTTDQVKSAAAKYTATTSADGAYTIGNVILGNYYLLVQKEGYADAVSKVIITSNSAATFNAAEVLIIRSEDVNKTGTIYGTITDAETGAPAESGLTLMLREGGNNVTGNVIATTTTGEEGAYSFSNSVRFGQYTVELADRRNDPNSQYIATSFSAIVRNEGENEANGTASRVIKAEQVRFQLRWGNEASGASRDLDSHLIGPTSDGKGVFHTWFEDLVYSDGVDESDNFTTYADLDVDDTTWEGPETTTIYKKSSGTYSFYVHDYTNMEDKTCDQMSKSSAVVRVYIGSRLMETFNMPANKAGILWYVCDYDASRNKIIARNEIISDWQGEPEDVGMSAEDILKNAVRRIDEVISEAEEVYATLPDSDLKTSGSAAIKEAKDAKASNDIQRINNARTALDDWFEQISEALKIEEFECDGIADWYTDWDEGEEDDFRVLCLTGVSESAPSLDSAKITLRTSGATYEWANSDKTGYLKKLIIKFGTRTEEYYVKYSVGEGTKLATELKYEGDLEYRLYDEEDAEFARFYWPGNKITITWDDNTTNTYVCKEYIDSYGENCMDYFPEGEEPVFETDEDGYTDTVNRVFFEREYEGDGQFKIIHFYKYGGGEQSISATVQCVLEEPAPEDEAE